MSLIELMVASVISLIVTTAAMSLAVGIMRATYNTQAQAEISARQAMTHGFIERNIDSVGFLWDVTQAVGTGNTGAWGYGYCVPSTNVCGPAVKQALPLLICGSNGLDAGDDCPTPTTAAADGVKALVPRDDLLDMVEITGLGGGPVPTTCGALGSPAAFDVVGITREGWTAGDLLLIQKRNHVTVARLANDFAADTQDPPVTRTLRVDVGTVTDFELDDGGRTTGGCDASDRLNKSNVFRIKQVMFRVAGGELQLAENRTASEAAAPTWIPLVEGIDDMQLRLDIMAVPSAGSASTCQCNVTNVLSGSTFAAGSCPSCTGGERLNGDPAVDDVHRIIGLQIGLMMHAGPELDPTGGSARSYNGMFDRSGVTLATDTKLRRRATYYLGLRNAQMF